MALNFSGINSDKFFQVTIVAFLAIQGISWIISQVSDIPILKGGWFLILTLVIILLTTLYTIGKNFTTLNLKKDGIFMLLVFIAIVLLFIFLPKIIPSIFSASGFEFREFLIKNAGNIIDYGGTGVV